MKQPSAITSLLTAGLSLAAGMFLAGLRPVRAAENITGFVDASGRVVFVNESDPPAKTPAAPRTNSRTAPGRKLIAKATAAPKIQPLQANFNTPPGEMSGAAADSGPSVDETDVSAQNTGFTGHENIQELIEEAARRHQVDADLVHAIVRVESNYNPYAVSTKGARGLMQLIPATARRFGVYNSFDPRANLDGGIRYLKYLMGMFNGDLQLSLAAYNAGEMAVTRNGGVPPYRETQDYIRKISELYPMRNATVAAAAPAEPKIVRYVDNTGVVHFSNTDLP